MSTLTRYYVGNAWTVRLDPADSEKVVIVRNWKLNRESRTSCSRGWIIDTIGLDGIDGINLERSEET